MSVRFNFVLDDVDAQQLLNVLKSEALRMGNVSLDACEYPSIRSWAGQRAKDIDELIGKVTRGSKHEGTEGQGGTESDAYHGKVALVVHGQEGVSELEASKG